MSIATAAIITPIITPASFAMTAIALVGALPAAVLAALGRTGIGRGVAFRRELFFGRLVIFLSCRRRRLVLTLPMTNLGRFQIGGQIVLDAAVALRGGGPGALRRRQRGGMVMV